MRTLPFFYPTPQTHGRIGKRALCDTCLRLYYPMVHEVVSLGPQDPDFRLMFPEGNLHTVWSLLPDDCTHCVTHSLVDAVVLQVLHSCQRRTAPAPGRSPRRPVCKTTRVVMTRTMAVATAVTRPGSWHG